VDVPNLQNDSKMKHILCHDQILLGRVVVPSSWVSIWNLTYKLQWGEYPQEIQCPTDVRKSLPHFRNKTIVYKIVLHWFLKIQPTNHAIIWESHVESPTSCQQSPRIPSTLLQLWDPSLSFLPMFFLIQWLPLLLEKKIPKN